MVRFLKRRWKIIVGFLAFVGLLGTVGIWLGVFIPVLGTPVFLGALYVWYIPGILFSWTGYFVFHEFGAVPIGWQGHAIMIAFYLAVAILVSLPFGRNKD